MSGLHLQKQHILLETMPVQRLEEGRILNLALSERNDFAVLHTLLHQRLSMLRLSYGNQGKPIL
jgi:hypothetical protein